MNCNWITPVVTNASSTVGHVVLICLHMCVQLRPVIKDDSMLQAVFKVCLKYTSTQKWCQKWDSNPRLFVTVSRLARSNAFEINNALNTLKGARLTVNLTGKARKSAIDVGRLLITTETVRSSTPSATGVIAKDTYKLYAGRPGSQSEKGKWLNTRWNNEQRISQWTCSLLPHTSINRRFYYKSRTST